MQSKWKPVIMVPLSLQTQRALKNAVARKGGQGNLVLQHRSLKRFLFGSSVFESSGGVESRHA